jgi:beta-barrel assembly-enhancing protease
MSKRLALPLAAALTFGLVAPASADIFRPGRNDQIQLGRRAAQEIRQKERVLPETDERVRLVRRVGSRLLSGVDAREPWEYSFDVIDNRAINAFALPGGPIFIYTGLLDILTTEDQLAGIMAHEIIHIRQEHWANAYAEQQRRNLGLSLLLILTRANRTITDIAQIGSEVVMGLPYSRRMETEADDLGLQMMARGGYNPMGMAHVFERMQAASRGGRPPEFLSTHPSEAGRIRRIEQQVQGMNRAFPAQRALPRGIGAQSRTGSNLGNIGRISLSSFGHNHTELNARVCCQ